VAVIHEVIFIRQAVVNQVPSFCVRASNDWQALSLVNHGSVMGSLNIEGIGEALTTVEALRLQD
jgi:hypothetical protein